jgi:hypothetical protein
MGYGLYQVVRAFHEPSGSIGVAGSSSKLNTQALNFAVLGLSDELKHAVTGSNASPIPRDQAASLAQINLSVTARNFEADYDANEIAADAKYKGKRFLLSGAIESIDKDFTDQGVLTLRTGSLTGVQAALNQRGMQNADLLQKGDKIDLVCHSAGRVIGSAIANACERLSQYLEDSKGLLREEIATFLDGELPLPKTTGTLVAMLYEFGLHLPPSSTCFAAIDQACETQIEALSKDKKLADAIRNEMKQLLAKVKLR